jgi:hypothetical protein
MRAHLHLLSAASFVIGTSVLADTPRLPAEPCEEERAARAGGVRLERVECTRRLERAPRVRSSEPFVVTAPPIGATSTVDIRTTAAAYHASRSRVSAPRAN